MKDITEMSASVLSTLIRDRVISCEEVMQEYPSKINKYNPSYNAIVSLVDKNILIDQAKNADLELEKGIYRGWMHGMPHAVKDLAYAEGLYTSEGSPIIAGSMSNKRRLVCFKNQKCRSNFHWQDKYTGIWAWITDV